MASATPNRLSPTISPDAISTPIRWAAGEGFRFSQVWPTNAPMITGSVADIGR